MIYEDVDDSSDVNSHKGKKEYDNEGFVFVWEIYQTKLTKYFESSKKVKNNWF